MMLYKIDNKKFIEFYEEVSPRRLQWFSLFTVIVSDNWKIEEWKLEDVILALISEKASEIKFRSVLQHVVEGGDYSLKRHPELFCDVEGVIIH